MSISMSMFISSKCICEVHCMYEINSTPSIHKRMSEIYLNSDVCTH
jgi:hypothetical protein